MMYSREDTDGYVARLNRAWAEIERVDKEAKAKGTLVGRYIKHQYADGYAVYRIVRENKATVRIEVVTGIGDDWVLPAWGTAATISRKVAEQFIGRQDALDRLFAKKGN